MKADKPFVTAVIVGAGNGTRMGGKNKALIKIGDKSAFRLVSEAFCRSATVDDVVVVCRDEAEMRAEVADLSQKSFTYVNGGKSRAESVMNGIKAAKRAEFYCIHDCARPDCTVCTLIETSRNSLIGLALIAVVYQFANIVFTISSSYKSIPSGNQSTPVALKVKLSD